MQGVRKEDHLVMIKLKEITKKSVLLDALQREDKELAKCSKGGRKMEPLDGHEEKFDRQAEKCRILRDMIQALECEPVKKAMSEWQRLIMEEDKLGKSHQMTL